VEGAGLRTGPNEAVEYHTATAALRSGRPIATRRTAPLSSNATPGRSLATRRAVLDLIRAATLGSYGVTGLAAHPMDRLLGRLGLAQPGIRVRLDTALEIELDLTVAFGVPVAEVARQVDSAVRYSIHRALGRDVARLTIHVGGLRIAPGGVLPTDIPADPGAIGLRDLADSGTDLA
jgi:uncharacterized alkaline shock family protein YloU